MDTSVKYISSSGTTKKMAKLEVLNGTEITSIHTLYSIQRWDLHPNIFQNCWPHFICNSVAVFEAAWNASKILQDLTGSQG